jgi:hypothetical protein
MRQLVASGRLVDFILLLVAIEAAVLLVIQRRTGRGGDLVVNLLAGAALLLALRAALAGAAWQWIALWLAVSLPPHLVDLWRRLRR